MLSIRKSVVPIAALLTCYRGSLQAYQECNDNIPATAPDSRFRDNGDETVADLSTGLVWKQCAEGLHGRDCSQGLAFRMVVPDPLNHPGVESEWRLPTIKELASLLERRCHDPAINARLFPNTSSASFCSSTPTDTAGYFYTVGFFDGRFEQSGDNLEHTCHARLVRTGQ